jgi:hypothetical protein
MSRGKFIHLAGDLNLATGNRLRHLENVIQENESLHSMGDLLRFANSVWLSADYADKKRGGRAVGRRGQSVRLRDAISRSEGIPRHVSDLAHAERSHSHRGFSPVTSFEKTIPEPLQRFLVVSGDQNRLKRFIFYIRSLNTGLKPRCE